MKEKKKMNIEENLKNTCHYFDEIITSPQPSPRGEGAVVGEVTNHTNTGEVTRKDNSCHYERSEVIQSELNQHILDCHGSDEPRNDMKKSAAWFTALNEFRCRTDRASNSTLCRKSAFSLLEKALRSNPLTALLRSRLSRFSLSERRFACSYAFSLLENPFARTCHFLCFRSRKFLSSLTKFRSFATHSYGFSLAETMVVLVIVAIIMAVSSPLIVKKMKKDMSNSRLTVKSGQDIFVAAGQNQTFIIGSNDENNIKLVVNGKSEIKNKLIMTGNNNKQFEISQSGITSRINGNSFTFTVDEYGVTNLKSSIPDYSHMLNVPNNENYYKANEDGYIYVGNSLGNIEINTNSNCAGGGIRGGNNSDALSMNFEAANDVSEQLHNNNQIKFYGRVKKLPLLIPISEGTCFRCVDAPNQIVSLNGGNSTVQDLSDRTNQCYFIPLQNMVTGP